MIHFLDDVQVVLNIFKGAVVGQFAQQGLDFFLSGTHSPAIYHITGSQAPLRGDTLPLCLQLLDGEQDFGAMVTGVGVEEGAG